MMPGAAAITSSGETIRSLAAFCFLSSGNTSLPPAISTSSETQRRHLAKASFIAPGKRLRLVPRCDQSANGADHRKNAGDVALIEIMDGNTGADQFRRDLRLEIGEGEEEVGLSARILGISAEVKAETCGFSRRTCGGRTA